jgi:hypothetical protein
MHTTGMMIFMSSAHTKVPPSSRKLDNHKGTTPLKALSIVRGAATSSTFSACQAETVNVHRRNAVILQHGGLINSQQFPLRNENPNSVASRTILQKARISADCFEISLRIYGNETEMH